MTLFIQLFGFQISNYWSVNTLTRFYVQSLKYILKYGTNSPRHTLSRRLYKPREMIFINQPYPSFPSIIKLVPLGYYLRHNEFSVSKIQRDLVETASNSNSMLCRVIATPPYTKSSCISNVCRKYRLVSNEDSASNSYQTHAQLVRRSSS